MGQSYLSDPGTGESTLKWPNSSCLSVPSTPRWENSATQTCSWKQTSCDRSTLLQCLLLRPKAHLHPRKVVKKFALTPCSPTCITPSWYLIPGPAVLLPYPFPHPALACLTPILIPTLDSLWLLVPTLTILHNSEVSCTLNLPAGPAPALFLPPSLTSDLFLPHPKCPNPYT